MKPVSAIMQIIIHVNCPHCNNFIDLMDELDTYGKYHNEEGYLLKQAVPDGDWDESHKNFEVDDVTCTECKGSFNVKGLGW